VLAIPGWRWPAASGGNAGSGTAEGTAARWESDGRGEMALAHFRELATVEKKKPTPFSPTDCLLVGKSRKITGHASWLSGNSTRCLKWGCSHCSK